MVVVLQALAVVAEEGPLRLELQQQPLLGATVGMEQQTQSLVLL
jgi:hypothetical protein